MLNVELIYIQYFKTKFYNIAPRKGGFFSQLCQGTAFPPCVNTVLVAAFPSPSAVARDCSNIVE